MENFCLDMTFDATVNSVVYERYREGLKDLPIKMEFVVYGCGLNYWISAMIIDEEAV